MGRVLSGRGAREVVDGRIWLGPLLTGLSASVMIGLLSLPGPRVGQVAGVITPAGGGLSAFVALLSIDPDLRLVDERWDGRLIFVVSKRKDFARLARRKGALILFDAKSVGCGFRAKSGVAPDLDVSSKVAP